jgi:uncharacterized membrane protein
MPTIGSVGIFICGFGLLYKNFRDSKLAEANPEGEDAKKFNELLASKQEIYNFFVIIGAAVGIIILNSFIGFIPAVSLGMIACAKLLGDESWKTAILVGVLGGICMYIVFDVLLKVPMPAGSLAFWR